MTAPTRRRILAAAAACVPALAGCLSEDDIPEPAPTDADVTTTAVVTGLEIPWDLAFAGTDVFLTERDGGLLRFDADEVTDGSGFTAADGDEILAGADLPNRTAPGEGGTLGVAVHPEYPDERAIYVYYTADDGGLENRVIGYDPTEETIEPIVEGIPAATTHNGGRITVGPDDRLWVLTGDAEDPGLTQDPASLAGAVVRVTPDGDPAPDNPTFDGGDPRTYTIGHRNPQGIDVSSADEPILSEHGPVSRDEVSILEPGANYGWDVVRGGPDDASYENYADHEEYAAPLLNTGPDETWGPSGLAYYDADAISPWTGRLFVAGLVSETLFSIQIAESADALDVGEERTVYDQEWLDDRYVAAATPLFSGEFGRLRNATVGPRGALYLLTSNRDGRASGSYPREDDDRLLRIDPE